jgi:gamma-glutamyl:cysteine ligase YbdK (ATP-grasp superfamily)
MNERASGASLSNSIGVHMRLLSVTGLAVAGVGFTLCAAYVAASETPPDNQRTTAKPQKAEAETKEAAQAWEDYAYAQKAEFVHKMKGELAKIHKELDRLSAKVDKSSSAAKADAKTKLKAVHKKWAQAKKQLDRAESATESTWDDVKAGFKKSYGELKDSFGDARQWLSDKIAP